MTSGRAVLGLVHEGLGMLDTHTYGEGLAGHGRAGLAHHLEGVAGGVPAGQHDAIGREDLLRARALVDKANGGDARLVIFAAGPLRSIGDARFGNALARKHQPIKARKEPHLSPGLLDGPTQVAHDVDEQVGADMGLGVHEDVRRRAGLHEGLQHMTDMGRFDARVQLAVGKRARTALTELDIRALIERGTGIEGLDDDHALVHGSPTLHHERLQPGAGQIQRAEQPRRPCPDHDRPQPGRFHARYRKRLRGLVGLHRHTLRRSRRSTLREFNRHGHDAMHVRLLPSIDRPLQQLHLNKRTPLHPERPRDFSAEERFVFWQESIKRNRNIGSLNHARNLSAADQPASSPEAQAQCRLNPPHAASTSSASPTT